MLKFTCENSQSYLELYQKFTEQKQISQDSMCYDLIPHVEILIHK